MYHFRFVRLFIVLPFRQFDVNGSFSRGNAAAIVVDRPLSLAFHGRAYSIAFAFGAGL